jgi:hypothetical protein
MLFLAGVLAIMAYHRQRSAWAALVAALLCAFPVFIRPACMFALCGAFLSLNVHTRGWRKTATDPKCFMFIAVSILPALCYTIGGLSVTGDWQSQTQTIFGPKLLFSGRFWKGWFTLFVRLNGGPVMAAAALLGFALLRRGVLKVLLAGLWLGYVIFDLRPSQGSGKR